jgi:hypothetical protein
MQQSAPLDECFLGLLLSKDHLAGLGGMLAQADVSKGLSLSHLDLT